MGLTDAVKVKKLPLGAFRESKVGPKPARIFITMKYSKQWRFLERVRGFELKGWTWDGYSDWYDSIEFEMPVTPATIQLDFGNEKDTENIPRIGEVVLPKYKKAIQIRWESFFPYDTSAKYLNSNVRGSVDELFGNAKKAWGTATVGAMSLITGKNLFPAEPTPALYINIFKYLSETEEPFKMGMTFYEGGNLEVMEFTLNGFSGEYENNGDFKYDISLVEYTDIQPIKLDSRGNALSTNMQKQQDTQMNTTAGTSPDAGMLQNISNFWNFCKKFYGTASKYVVFASATYNGVRNLVFRGVLKLWQLKGNLKGLKGRLGILNNIIGSSGITKNDTTKITEALRQISYTEQSKKMAEFIQKNM